MQTTLSYIEVKPSAPLQHIVIWLHGLGANGNDFAPIVPQLHFPSSTLFMFPNAPLMPITINQNAVMPGWYDILETHLFGKEDQKGIIESCSLIHDLITKATSLVPSHKIYIMGFSQGGAMAIYSGLTFHEKLGGIACLSGYAPIKNSLKKKPTSCK